MTRATLAVIVGLTITLCTAAPGAAQEGRAALLAGNEAWMEGRFERAVTLLSLGLDPTAGEIDTTWTSGLHRLVDALQFEGREDLVGIWLRWAFRLERELAVDEENFPPPVTDAFQRARSEVENTTLDTARVRARWVWSPDAGASASGWIRIAEGPVEVNGQVEGGPFLAPGADVTLPVGSYTVLGSATDYLPARITVEVLPGVTTELDFTLEPSAAGFLYVASRPWGDVFVDGERIGYTAINAHRLAAGRHQLRILRDGYLPFDTTITVGRDEAVRLGTIQLRSPEPSR